MLATVFAEVTVNIALIQEHMKVWEPFRDMWELEKDKFMEKYERKNPTAEQFDANIGRYTEVANNVQMLETVMTVHFMVINSADLKAGIIGHCVEWQRRLCMLLYKRTEKQIYEIHTYMKENAEK